MNIKQISAIVAGTVAVFTALMLLGQFLGIELRPAWIGELNEETKKRVELEVDYRANETRGIKRDIYEIEQQQQAIDPTNRTLQEAYSDQLILLREDLDISQEKLDVAKNRLENIIESK